jgi:hypothetical protein
MAQAVVVAAHPGQRVGSARDDALRDATRHHAFLLAQEYGKIFAFERVPQERFLAGRAAIAHLVRFAFDP